MGRWTDKPFISQGEWSNTNDDGGGLRFGGKSARIQGRAAGAQGGEAGFDCCALSLKPFAQPVCTPDGYVFDEANIAAYIKEHGKHPFTGAELAADALVQLRYHKNAGGDYADPVTLKQFTHFTKIAANRRSGHVYLWSTIDEFNIKPDAWADLVTGEPFAREDIIVLHDPKAPKAGSRAAVRKETEIEPAAAAATTAAVAETGRTPKPHNAAHYSKGLAAAALTSTAVAPVTRNEAEVVDSEEYMFARIKSKGYARLVTSLGDINVELYCDKAPRACYNFIKLAQAGYYRGTVFHRSIRNFMVQGGDPTGTGRGGKSFWGGEFRDEIAKKLAHSERGVLSMANRGPNTNTSQFFVLYRAARQLDGKHTVFGRVVGGLAVLGQMEAVPTDDADRPLTDIVLADVTVFVDPFAEFARRLERKLEHERDAEALATGKRARTAAEEEQHERDTTTWFGAKLPARGADVTADNGTAAVPGRGVGKYLKKPKFAKPAADDPPKAADAPGYKFGSFSGW
ncbi:cyclophilin peptidyl-prolyl cis-trans isomerase Cyp8 [Coemansia nantahalensis]|uniref:Cyclophilin peptidyl-prolyl cis-trans isomerase Cyp8 n=1 Tax=Coemansia nantahalensis TaxID=2789366 RepID=A0ACC1JUV8_9FUNG|nr:cyclophilin peptidyl-prolyl cis-trans isomerase Cyp8 [Coemansia nantahalensis]